MLRRICNFIACILFLVFTLLTACSKDSGVVQPVQGQIEGAMRSINRPEVQYNIEIIKDLGAERIWDLQSMVIKDNNVILFNGKTYPWIIDLKDYSMQQMTTNHGVSSHDNDCCLIGNDLYFVGNGAPHNGNNFKNLLYHWDMDFNNTDTLNVSDIRNRNNNNSMRCLSAVCNFDDQNLLLVTNDFLKNKEYDSQERFVTIYRYDLMIQKAEELCSFTWEGGFIQGAVLVQNYLFINYNIKTDYASNYKGVEIKVIDINNFSIVDSLQYCGKFEPEGLTYYKDGGDSYLIFGIANHGKKCVLTRMKLNIGE